MWVEGERGGGGQKCRRGEGRWRRSEGGALLCLRVSCLSDNQGPSPLDSGDRQPREMGTRGLSSFLTEAPAPPLPSLPSPAPSPTWQAARRRPQEPRLTDAPPRPPLPPPPLSPLTLQAARRYPREPR